MSADALLGPDLLSFEAPPPQSEESLVVDLDGYEGPLDLLLSLARAHKVDLSKISLLALAEQYLTFIETARRLRLEIAADYLVMAAWLAYLKSRLLLPEDEPDDEGPGDELAGALAFRLRRLEAMREAGRKLMARSRLGVDVFPRGMPEPVSVHTERIWDARLYDVLSAYAALRLHRVAASVELPRREVFSLAEARDRLVSFLGETADWAVLDACLVEHLSRPELRSSARASALSASLELAREGSLELRQNGPFAPLYLRRRVRAAAAALGGARA